MKKSVLSKYELSDEAKQKMWAEFVNVCNEYDEKPEAVFENNRSRKRRFVEIRYLTMLSVKSKNETYTFDKIGLYFGLDHSTVIYGINTANDLIKSDKNFRAIAEKILNK
jgi:chromosomal replication initiation ATPase DnaA